MKFIFNTFDKEFDAFKSIGFLRSTNSRNLRLLFFSKDVQRFIKSYPQEAKRENDELDTWIKSYTDEAENILVKEIF